MTRARESDIGRTLPSWFDICKNQPCQYSFVPKAPNPQANLHNPKDIQVNHTKLLLICTLLSAPLLALADQVTCESVNNRRVKCDMNTRGEVRLVRQLSRTACIENTNWGVNRSSIWVDGGCRAVFAREGTGGAQPSRADIAREDAQYDSSGRAPAAAIRACNKFADQGYDSTIVSQNAMKPGWWEVILRFEQYRYACNVSSRGQVESFNKIN